MHDHYEKVVDSGQKAANTIWWKALLLGVLGGIFVGLGFAGYDLIMSSYNPKLLGTKITASLVFCIGLIMTVFLGGWLFTSNSLIVFAVLEKKAKIRKAALVVSLVWIGNFIGGLLIALVVWGAGTFGKKAIIDYSIKVAESKAAIDPGMAILSGFLCNLLVAGSVTMVYSVKNPVAKILLILIPIAIFVMFGFQHVVANMFAFSIGGLKGAHLTASGVILHNLIPVTFGNFLAGGIFIPVVYWLLNKKTTKKLKEKKALEEQKNSKEEIKDKTKEEKQTEK